VILDITRAVMDKARFFLASAEPEAGDAAPALDLQE
jgi:hypothetical protein